MLKRRINCTHVVVGGVLLLVPHACARGVDSPVEDGFGGQTETGMGGSPITAGTGGAPVGVGGGGGTGTTSTTAGSGGDGTGTGGAGSTTATTGTAGAGTTGGSAGASTTAAGTGGNGGATTVGAGGAGGSATTGASGNGGAGGAGGSSTGASGAGGSGGAGGTGNGGSAGKGGSAGTSGQGGAGGSGGTGGAGGMGGSAPPPPKPTGITIGTAAATAQQPAGATGGSVYTQQCMPNEVVVGYSGTADDPDSSMSWIRTFQAQCASLSIAGTTAFTVRTTRAEMLPSIGAQIGTMTLPAVACPANQVVIGFAGNSGGYMDNFAFICAPLVIGGTAPNYTLTTGSPTTIMGLGGPGGTPFTPINCPQGRIAVGDAGRSGTAIDAFSLLCATPRLVVQ